MTNYLTGIVLRNQRSLAGVRPRLPSRFENKKRSGAPFVGPVDKAPRTANHWPSTPRPDEPLTEETEVREGHQRYESSDLHHPVARGPAAFSISTIPTASPASNAMEQSPGVRAVGWTGKERPFIEPNQVEEPAVTVPVKIGERRTGTGPLTESSKEGQRPKSWKVNGQPEKSAPETIREEVQEIEGPNDMGREGTISAPLLTARETGTVLPTSKASNAETKGSMGRENIPHTDKIKPEEPVRISHRNKDAGQVTSSPGVIPLPELATQKGHEPVRHSRRTAIQMAKDSDTTLPIGNSTKEERAALTPPSRTTAFVHPSRVSGIVPLPQEATIQAPAPLLNSRQTMEVRTGPKESMDVKLKEKAPVIQPKSPAENIGAMRIVKPEGIRPHSRDLGIDNKKTTAQEPNIQVTIGRIEVRAIPTKEVPGNRRKVPELDLANYLQSSARRQ
jgi:hypothetical protein